MIKTLEWTEQGVRFIDQTQLPTEETYVLCPDYKSVATAIKDMVVRGAPAIGVAAAMGVALGARDAVANSVAELRPQFDEICRVMRDGKPPSDSGGGAVHTTCVVKSRMASLTL